MRLSLQKAAANKVFTMLSLSALFGIMMLPVLALLITSLVVSAFEQEPHGLGSELTAKAHQ